MIYVIYWLHGSVQRLAHSNCCIPIIVTDKIMFANHTEIMASQQHVGRCV